MEDHHGRPRPVRADPVRLRQDADEFEPIGREHDALLVDLSSVTNVPLSADAQELVGQGVQPFDAVGGDADHVPDLHARPG